MCCSPKTIENKTNTIFIDMEIQKMQIMISLNLVQNKMFILVNPFCVLYVCLYAIVNNSPIHAKTGLNRVWSVKSYLFVNTLFAIMPEIE